ncbi:GNAT family N-acetyltransferase [Desmospora profundinema]|uniref:Ribosomal protein S18 acetylase RimI-like enzyme n=1 Tax=Desmospora profundinema TaxID=1571184 RepID=A0ABU1IPJ3_9BACL|nr:GNAT family N-acetyltransferase [Desmospora profundinema]MDR6226641.1 ribosomal protein S18 acetylase RimI-like enzyme [Desmospora profundinema]
MIQKMEEYSLNAWPALQTIVHDGWLLRFSDGYTNRANSIHPIYDSHGDIERKIAYCEDIYSHKRLKTIYKMTSSVYPANLDEVLVKKGYEAMDDTSVQILNLTEMKQPLIHTVKRDEKLTNSWFNHFCRLTKVDPNHRFTIKQMLSSIIFEKCFFSLYLEDRAVACGLGTIKGGYLGIFDMITDSHHRNRGLGEQLMLHLLNWGIENEAKQAYLQVMLTNGPARRLYSKLGFQEAYKYWYRVKQ